MIVVGGEGAGSGDPRTTGAELLTRHKCRAYYCRRTVVIDRGDGARLLGLRRTGVSRGSAFDDLRDLFSMLAWFSTREGMANEVLRSLGLPQDDIFCSKLGETGIQRAGVHLRLHLTCRSLNLGV